MDKQNQNTTNTQNNSSKSKETESQQTVLFLYSYDMLNVLHVITDCNVKQYKKLHLFYNVVYT